MNQTYVWTDWSEYAGMLPEFLLALAVLLIGWLIAKAIANGTEKLLHKTKLDNKLLGRMENRTYPPEKIIGKIVYYLLLVFVFILVFNILELSFIATPLVGMLSSITGAIPHILKAALLLAAAWVIASLLAAFVRRIGKSGNVQRTLTKVNAAKTEADAVNTIDRAAKLVFYFTFFLFLPGILSALEIDGIAGPFAGMMEKMLAFLPKLFAAALILFIGWFIARLVRDLVTGFLQTAGAERLTARLGLGNLFEGTSLSAVIGTIVYILILIPTVISALERLEVRGISEPAIAMLNDILTMLPNILVAIVLILVGLWLGRWTGQIVTRMLERMGINSLLKSMGIGKGTRSNPAIAFSQSIGKLVYILIVFLFAVEALQVVQLDFLVTLGTGVIAYLPHVLAALVILAVGLYVGSLAEKLVAGLINGPSFRLLSSVAKYAVIAVSLFMALDQLGVAHSIVNAAFILILGGLALAFGLSFGLGGRELAAKYLRKLDEKVEENKGNLNQ
jgi:hypothetical protein